MKKSKRQKTINASQTEFLSQTAEGKEEKEAFYNAIKAANKKNKLSKDTYSGVEHKRTEGEYKAAKSISLEDVSTWIDVIAKIEPILVSIYDWVDSRIIK